MRILLVSRSRRDSSCACYFLSAFHTVSEPEWRLCCLGANPLESMVEEGIHALRRTHQPNRSCRVLAIGETAKGLSHDLLTDYPRSSDDASELELIGRAKQGEEEAFSTLFRAFRPLIFKIARTYFVPGGDQDDLLQEATIGFFKAVRDYRWYLGPFRSFVELCTRRQVITHIKTATRQKHLPLNHAISLDSPVFDDSSESLSDRLPAAQEVENDPDEVEFLETLWNRCSALERHILSLYTKGFTFDEMANLIGTHYKSIDNAVWRVKVKAKKLAAQEIRPKDVAS